MRQLFERSTGFASLLPTFPFRNPWPGAGRTWPPLTVLPEPETAVDTLQPLRDCAATLAPFIQESETALAGIGSVLSDLCEGTTHIRGDAESARDSIASMAGAASAQLLEIRTTLQRAIGQLQGNRALLDSLDSRLTSIIQDFAALEAGVREFRIVGTLIRIEGSSRAADAEDFVHISDRSAAITGNLGDLVGQIQGATGALRVAFRTIAREIHQLNATSEAGITAIASDIMALDKVMSAEHVAIGSAAQTTIEGLEVIGQSIGDVVCALQIHDILRQQSEHSLAAIEEVCLPPGLPPAGQQACEAVVHAQISHTLTLCQEAAQKVETGLLSAATQLRGIGAITSNISGLTRLDAPSRRAVQTSTRAILAALPLLDKGDEALEKAMAEIQGGAAAILAVVDKVSSAMLDMRWLGLNAIIQSVNRAQPGSAIELLGSRTVTITDGVDHECGRIRAAIDQLREDIDAYTRATVGSLGERGIRQVAEDSVVLLDSVHRSIRTTMERQASLQESLQTKLDKAQAALSCFRDTQTRPAEAVGRIAPGPHSCPQPGELSPAVSTLLESWFSRYTMSSERRVHCAALGVPFNETESEALAEGEIELF
jgi:hypothetical protein